MKLQLKKVNKVRKKERKEKGVKQRKVGEWLVCYRRRYGEGEEKGKRR